MIKSKYSWLVFLICLLYTGSSSLFGFSKNGLTPDEQNNISVFKATNKSVVWVTNTQMQRDYFSLNVYEIPGGTGTGFIWDRTGLVVTNFHVIQNASKITITLSDHSNWEAEIVGAAPSKDLAVLRIKPPKIKLIPIHVGDSSDLEVGRKVLAIGNPFGLDATLTVGVVSALGREISAENGSKLRGLIQTDAAINPGNSGGPLLNSRGELIGVNTAIYSPSGGSAGIGFAIPVNEVKKIIPQLIKHGRIMRPVIGIYPAEDSIAQNYGIEGVVVVRAIQNAPAARAGIEGIKRNRNGYIILGDVIVKIDNFPIKNNDDLMVALEQYKPGDTVTVYTMKNSRSYQYKLRLANSSIE